MLPNKLRKFGEMALPLQDLTPKLCLCHFTVEVRGYGSIKRPRFQINIPDVMIWNKRTRFLRCLLSGCSRTPLQETLRPGLHSKCSGSENERHEEKVEESYEMGFT